MAKNTYKQDEVLEEPFDIRHLLRASSYIKDKQPDFSLKEYYSKFYKLIQDFPEKYKLEKSHTKYQCK